MYVCMCRYIHIYIYIYAYIYIYIYVHTHIHMLDFAIHNSQTIEHRGEGTTGSMLTTGRPIINHCPPDRLSEWAPIDY